MGMIFSSPEDALQVKINSIHDTLRARGVPEVRIPDPKHTISHIMSWVDQKKQDDWVDGFAKLESVSKGEQITVVGSNASPATEVVTQVGDAVLQTKEKVTKVAGNILKAAKNAIKEAAAGTSNHG